MNINQRNNQGGFTLIELVIVIVILGILAAVAVPRYVDLSEEAVSATCDGIKGGVLSSAAILIADSDSTTGLGEPESVADILSATSGYVASGTGGWTATTNGCTVTVTLEDGSNSCDAFDIPADLTSTDCS